jgi:hypothetical protein
MYVLILCVMALNGATLTSAQFATKDACVVAGETAKIGIKGPASSFVVSYVCAPNGKQEGRKP